MENKQLPQPKYAFNYIITNRKDKNNVKKRKKEYLDDLLDQKFLNNYFNRHFKKY